MKTVVITGSTRGIGFALSREFLKRDCQVVVSSRTQQAVVDSVNTLAAVFTKTQIAGFPCDVTDIDQVRNLWRKSKDQFKTVDIWINNAGISNEQALAWEVPDAEIKSVIETNILGELYGTKVAMNGFLEQGYGALYNIEGLGADGKTHHVKGLSIYGMTKAGMNYFNKCLAQENTHPNIITGALQPGMVLTDLVKGQYEEKPEEWDRVKGMLKIIANPIDEVAPWLAEKILGNQKNGAYIKYGSTFRILKRIILSPFRK